MSDETVDKLMQALKDRISNMIEDYIINWLGNHITEIDENDYQKVVDSITRMMPEHMKLTWREAFRQKIVDSNRSELGSTGIDPITRMLCAKSPSPHDN